MKIVFLPLLLSGCLLLAACDSAEEAKTKLDEASKAAETFRKEADAAVDSVKNSAQTEWQNAKQAGENMLNHSLAEETKTQVDNMKNKIDEVGNMKVSDLLSFGSASSSAVTSPGGALTSDSLPAHSQQLTTE